MRDAQYLFNSKYIAIYYLLPILILSCLSFNTMDGKHYISRLVVAMFFVGLLMARNILIENLKNLLIKKMLMFWLSIAFVLSCYHLIRGEAFGAARAILVSLLYIAIVPWSSIPRQHVLTAIVLGGITSGFCGLYESEVLNIRRVGGDVNQIPFALYVAITLLFAIFSLKIYQHKAIKLFAWISIAGSCYAIIMSEVRGIWLAISCVAMVILLWHIADLTAKKIIIIIASVLLSLQLLSAVDQFNIRINETKNEFVQIAQGNKDTSIGIRFQLWQSAIEIIKDHPFMGMGTQAYQRIMVLQQQQGLITSTALSFKDAHFHNQYLDSYVRYGIIGLVISILMCLSPLILYRAVNTDIMKVFFSFSVLVLIAGLTDSPFIHTGIIYMLVIYPAVIILTD